jgi:hypothetical protein
VSSTEPEQTVASILPAGDQPTDVDDELAQIEADLDAIPSQPDDFDMAVLPPEDDPQPIGRGWAYDWESKRFVRAPQGWQPMQTQGEQTLREWVAKCMRTQRGAHPVHPEDYGMDDPFLLVGLPATDAPVGQYEDDLRQALTFHPRIADVTDFSSSVDQDSGTVQLTFTVVLDDDSEVTFDQFALP